MCARLATGQHGVVGRDQLLDAGIERGAIDRLIRSGALHRLHHGVYAVGHLAMAPRAREQAALLACGPRALISHWSAAHIWGIAPSSPTVDVTLVASQRRPKPGIRTHRVSTIDDRDVRRNDRLWLTSPARTLIDLAADAGLDELERLVSEARAKRLLRRGELEAMLKRVGRCRGAARMRSFLRSEQGPAFTRSKGERTMRRLLRAARLPMPQVNARFAGYEIDFLWAAERVIVEVDGYDFHSHRRAFERDRRKDMALRDAGYEVIRISWRQLTEEPFVVIAHIARALDRAARKAG